MQAALYHRYGPADVVSIGAAPRPTPRKDELLVRVEAAGVTTGDWRLRAAAFPGLLMQIAGRLMFGIMAPRVPILGGDFAGTVIETGATVTGFRPGDAVFGFSGTGAHAEYLTIKASGAVVHRPAGLQAEPAAAMPFGALSALSFLQDKAQVRPGQRVLIVGASGGVGAYAVQVARALGAEVTGMASGARAALVRDLGAASFVDYRRQSPEGPFDVIFDTVGALDYARAAPLLAPGGAFVPLNFGPKDMLARRRARRAGHRLILAVNSDTKDGMQRLATMVAQGDLRPVIDRRLPFAAIREAYAVVETRHRAGAVVLSMDGAPRTAAA